MRWTMLGSCATAIAAVAAAHDPNANPANNCAATDPKHQTPLLGAGHCVDKSSDTPNGYSCSGASCPSTVDTCATACIDASGCTGFELHTKILAAKTCVLFVAAQPQAQGTWTQVEGTQADFGRTIVQTKTAANTCCYKKNWPRPNPKGNPVKLPPRQSDIQKEIFARKAKLAKAASKKFKPQLEKVIEYCAKNTVDEFGEPVGIFNATECPGMADLTHGKQGASPTAAQILERFSAELRAAEYGHGYEVLDTLMDMDYVYDPTYPWMMNLYQPCALGLNLTDEDHMCGMAMTGGGGGPQYDKLEQLFFGCPPLTTNETVGAPPTDFIEASNRILFNAMNFLKAPFGNSEYYGHYNALLKPDYIANMTLMTPTDSFHYLEQWPDCIGWENCTVGTFQDHYHLLYAWITGGGPEGYPTDPTPTTCKEQMSYITHLNCNLPPRRGDQKEGECPVFVNYELYMEADVLGNVLYPDGIKFFTASFPELFGTYNGTKLQDFCVRNGWLLMWVNVQQDECYDARRMIDPVTLKHSTANLTLAPAVGKKFNDFWEIANQTWEEYHQFYNYTEVWIDYVNNTAQESLLWTPSLLDCQDYNECVGIKDTDGTCVCYQK